MSRFYHFGDPRTLEEMTMSGANEEKIDYAQYETRRRKIIAMLKAACYREVLHLMTVSPATDPYEAAKRIYGWTKDYFEVELEDNFLVPFSGEDPPTEQEVREMSIKAAAEVLPNGDE